jgi:hypothetical protein
MMLILTMKKLIWCAAAWLAIAAIIIPAVHARNVPFEPESPEIACEIAAMTIRSWNRYNVRRTQSQFYPLIGTIHTSRLVVRH